MSLKKEGKISESTSKNSVSNLLIKIKISEQNLKLNI